MGNLTVQQRPRIKGERAVAESVEGAGDGASVVGGTLCQRHISGFAGRRGDQNAADDWGRVFSCKTVHARHSARPR